MTPTDGVMLSPSSLFCLLKDAPELAVTSSRFLASLSEVVLVAFRFGDHVTSLRMLSQTPFSDPECFSPNHSDILGRLRESEGSVPEMLTSLGLSGLTLSFWFLLAERPSRVPPQLLLKLTVE